MNKVAVMMLSRLRKGLGKKQHGLYVVALAWLIYETLTKSLLSNQQTSNPQNQSSTDASTAIMLTLPSVHLIQFIQQQLDASSPLITALDIAMITKKINHGSESIVDSVVITEPLLNTQLKSMAFQDDRIEYREMDYNPSLYGEFIDHFNQSIQQAALHTETADINSDHVQTVTPFNNTASAPPANATSIAVPDAPAPTLSPYHYLGLASIGGLTATFLSGSDTNYIPTGKPSITVDGKYVEGATALETLTASRGTVEDRNGINDSTITWQWLRNDEAITDSTGNQFTTTITNDMKNFISVTMAFKDNQDNAHQVTSLPIYIDHFMSDSGTFEIENNHNRKNLDYTNVGDTLDVYLIQLPEHVDRGQLRYQWFALEANQNEETAISDIRSQSTLSVTTNLQDLWVFAKVFIKETIGDTQVYHPLFETEAAHINNPPSGTFRITPFAPKQGDRLFFDLKQIKDKDGINQQSIQYQWHKDGTPIEGATSKDYTLTKQAEVGSVYTVTVKYTDQRGQPETITSMETIPLQDVNWEPEGFVAITLPSDYTEPQVGDTLTAFAQIIDADGIKNESITYTWFKSNGTTSTQIQSSTSNTYTITARDESSSIFVEVSYTDNSGNPHSLTSEPTALVPLFNHLPTGNVTISGSFGESTNYELETLTCNVNLSDKDGIKNTSFQWYRDGAKIPDKTKNTYKTKKSDIDKIITVKVTVLDKKGFTAEFEASTTAIANTPEKHTGNLVIKADTDVVKLTNLKVGQEIKLIDTVKDNDGKESHSYQWLRDGEAISEGISENYTIKPADEGKTLSAKVSYTEYNGDTKTVVSNNSVTIPNTDFQIKKVTSPSGVTNYVMSGEVSSSSDVDQLFVSMIHGDGSVTTRLSLTKYWSHGSNKWNNDGWQYTFTDLNHLIGKKITDYTENDHVEFQVVYYEKPTSGGVKIDIGGISSYKNHKKLGSSGDDIQFFEWSAKNGPGAISTAYAYLYDDQSQHIATGHVVPGFRETQEKGYFIKPKTETDLLRLVGEDGTIKSSYDGYDIDHVNAYSWWNYCSTSHLTLHDKDTEMNLAATARFSYSLADLDTL